MPTTSSASTAAIREKCSSDICSPGTACRSPNTRRGGSCHLTTRRRLQTIPSNARNSLSKLGLVAGRHDRQQRQRYPQPRSRYAAVPPARLLVARVVHNAGYNLLSFTRAFAVLNCQSALVCFLLRSASHALDLLLQHPLIWNAPVE